MKVFVLAGNLPSREHGVRAANMVLGCLVDRLVTRGHQVTFQPVFAERRRDWTVDEEAMITSFRGPDMEFLPPFFREDYQRKYRKAFDWVFARALYHHPALRLEQKTKERIKAAGADVALVFWNPECLAAVAEIESVPKIVYYGMPDHEASLARLFERELFGLKSYQPAKLKRKHQRILSLEQCHLQLMQKCDVVTNLSADHAEYYREQGHPQSRYVPNMWPEPGQVGSTSERDYEAGFPATIQFDPAAQKRKPVIIGNIGRPAATGNTFGLQFLGEEILPSLDAELGADGYEMHILGAGDPVPMVKRALQHPAVRMRGWVDDIDQEIVDADVFLVANNAGRYRGSHTRFLHAWSLGACCVGHSYNELANPEMKHLDNVLLGETAAEMAALIARAIREPELRNSIAQRGYETYQECFRPRVVVDRLIEEMEAARAA